MAGSIPNKLSCKSPLEYLELCKKQFVNIVSYSSKLNPLPLFLCKKDFFDKSSFPLIWVKKEKVTTKSGGWG